MVELLESQREAIRDTCVRHRVASLYVFGSALGDEFRPGHSDVDFLVDFGGMDSFDRIDAYFDMLDELRALLGSGRLPSEPARSFRRGAGVHDHRRGDLGTVAPST